MLVDPANTIDGQFLDLDFLDIKQVVLTTVVIIKLDIANTIDFLRYKNINILDFLLFTIKITVICSLTQF